MPGNLFLGQMKMKVLGLHQKQKLPLDVIYAGSYLYIVLNYINYKLKEFYLNEKII